MITIRRLAVPAALALALAGCAQSQAISRSHASAAAVAACRTRADTIYNQRNRGEVYKADTFATSSRDSPFATTGLPGNTSAGLGSQYQRDQFQDDCLNSTGTGAVDAPEVGSGKPPPIR